MKSESHFTATASRARWMVVDDTDSVRNLIALLLQDLGDAEICCFRSGADALEAFAAAPGNYQFVITDLEMPGLNGLELCRQLLSINPDLKVLLTTGSSAIAAGVARDAGFCGLLNKPFPPSMLNRILEAAGVIRRIEEDKETNLPDPAAFLTTA